MMMVYLALSAFCAARSLVFPLFCPFLQPRFHRLGKLLFTRVGVKTLNLSLLGERRADDFKNGSLVIMCIVYTQFQASDAMATMNQDKSVSVQMKQNGDTEVEED